VVECVSQSSPEVLEKEPNYDNVELPVVLVFRIINRNAKFFSNHYAQSTWDLGPGRGRHVQRADRAQQSAGREINGGAQGDLSM